VAISRPSGMVSQTYNLPHVLNRHTLAEFARRMMAGRDADRAQ
jgi:hypothetical protein